MSKFIIYFDVETGGLEPRHPTIQLAAVAHDEETGREVANFDTKIIFPVSECDPEALKLNHYDPNLWTQAVSPGAAAAQFSTFVKPFSSIQMTSKRTGAPYYVAKLAGYNALTFDLPRLKSLYGTTFFPCSYHVRDVLQRAMWWVDEHRPAVPPANLKLGTMCEFFGIAVNGAHDALADVRLTAALAWRLRSGQ